MTEREKKSSKVQERASRGEDPATSVSKDRMEIWHPGYVGEISDSASDETLERSQTTGGKPAVRPRIKPASKDPGGN
jgi:hypothetical protein